MASIALSDFVYLVCLISLQFTAAKPGIDFICLFCIYSLLHGNFLILFSDGCGIRANTQTRIVGGEISYPGKWPWMAGNK